MVLDLDLPPVGEQPSCDEIVIIRVEKMVTAPCLMRESICEIGILEDLRPIGHGSSRKTRQAAIDPVAGCAVEIPPHQIDCPKKFPNVRPVLPTKCLVCSHASAAGIFEWGKYPFGKFFREPDVVVQQERDFRLHLWDGTRKLPTFVGLTNCQDLDSFWRIQLLNHLMETFDPGVRRD